MADELVTRDIPLTPAEVELLKLLKPNDPDDAFVICNGAHHGASLWEPEIGASCLFSFKMRKDVSRESRMKLLQALFSDLTARVDEAFGDRWVYH